MSWIEDLVYTHRFVCADNHESRYEFAAKDADANRGTIACGHEGCELDAEYAGFLPQEMNIVSKVTYDQNGRKAIKTDDGKGNITHMSATKAHYLETGVVNHHYTDAYKEKLEKDKEANAHLLQTDFNRRMAQVTAYTGKPKPGRKAASP